MKQKKNVFSLCREVNGDVAVVMLFEFHNLAAVTGKARLVAKCRVNVHERCC